MPKLSRIYTRIFLRPIGHIEITSHRNHRADNGRDKKGPSPAPVFRKPSDKDRRGHAAGSDAREEHTGSEAALFRSQPVGHYLIADWHGRRFTRTQSEANDCKSPRRAKRTKDEQLWSDGSKSRKNGEP